LLLVLISLELPSVCQHIFAITAKHSLLTPSLPYIIFVSYLLDYSTYPELCKSYFVPITYYWSL